MIRRWFQQELQFEAMKEQAQRYVTTFRWLWTLNLVAAVVGAVTGHYEVAAVAAVSCLFALAGVAFARMGQRTVTEATAESQRIQRASQKSDSE